jgi:hypothetical protein
MRRWAIIVGGLVLLIGAIYVGAIVAMNVGVDLRIPRISN